MNVLGRKRSCILVSLISLGGWILLATSNHLVTVCIARFIGGWVAACDGLICKQNNFFDRVLKVGIILNAVLKLRHSKLTVNRTDFYDKILLLLQQKISCCYNSLKLLCSHACSCCTNYFIRS